MQVSGNNSRFLVAANPVQGARLGNPAVTVPVAITFLRTCQTGLRGWRHLLTAEWPNVEVTITLKRGRMFI